MPELGKYAGEVLSAYVITIALMVLLSVWIWIQARKARRDLDAAEARRSNG